MKEKGSAVLRIDLTEGCLTVTHGETGEVLHRREAWYGEWDELWQFIRRPFPSNLRGIVVDKEELI